MIFKTELSKVFFTNVAVYFIAIIFANWMLQLMDYAQKFNKENQIY